MARPDCLLIPVLAAVALATSGIAQEPPQGVGDGKRDEKKEGDRGKHYREGKDKSPEMQNVRRALEALSPEQKKRFEENFYKWSNLPPEEKKSLRHRDESRRKRMAQDIDEAIQKAGLTLDQTQKEQFSQRYTEERRKLEEELRNEMNEKRQPRLEAIVGKLAKEFGSATPAPTP